MESRHFSLYRQTGLALLFALLLPLVAACGGTPVAAPTAAPAADAAPTAAEAVKPTEAPAAVAPTAASAVAATAAPAVTESDTSKFLVFGSSGEPDNLDTMETTSGVALYIGQQVVEKLIMAKPGTLDLQPGLASEWTPNADSSEWTFKLRSGVTFHDGTPFNADAVVFNFKRMAEPDFEFGFRDGEGAKTYAIFPDIFGGFKGDPNSVWEGVEKVDDTTVKFSFLRPLPLFPNYVVGDYFVLHGYDCYLPAAGCHAPAPASTALALERRMAAAAR